MSSIQNNDEDQLEISNILLDKKLLKFPLIKITHDDYDIKIKFKTSFQETQNDKIINLKALFQKDSESALKCSNCEKVIKSFEFFLQKESKNNFICKECHEKLKEKKIKEEYISFEKYISSCDKYEQNFNSFCINCNKNVCQKCKESHSNLHEFIIYDNMILYKDINEKINLCKKIKRLSNILKNISEIKELEHNVDENWRYKKIYQRFYRENKFAEIIISSFFYFYEKKALCYELISNFNQIKYNRRLNEINIISFLISISNLLEPSFHLIMQSPDILEKHKIKIVPLCERIRIYSDKSMDEEIRGLIELKNKYYIAGSKNGIIGIYDNKNLNLKQYFRLEGIKNIFHMEKIKDENSDLIAIASDLSDVIIISVFQDNKENNEIKDQINFKYKFECRKKEHNGQINRIIQLSNGLLVSAAEDELVIIWKLIKKDNIINIESITKIDMDMEIYILIECKYTNELYCNNKILDLNTLTPKGEIYMELQDKTFNCQMCLFKEKYLAFIYDCHGAQIINLETKYRYDILGKYDYAEAVYSIDNETICLCTQNLNYIFSKRYSQQYKLDEDNFSEIGKIIVTGT